MKYFLTSVQTLEAFDHPGEALINQGALHVDIAEQDAVKGVVQHDIQPLRNPFVRPSLENSIINHLLLFP